MENTNEGAAGSAQGSLPRIPQTPDEAIAFIGNQCEVHEDADNPENVRFQLTVHDLLSAFRWWFDTDLVDPASARSDEVLALHRHLAAEKLRADQGWQRAEAKSKECIELRERMAGTPASPVAITAAELAALAWKHALDSAAFYVAGHCANGEHHAETILGMPMPEIAIAPTASTESEKGSAA